MYGKKKQKKKNFTLSFGTYIMFVYFFGALTYAGCWENTRIFVNHAPEESDLRTL